jgi:hypothetical protein
LDDILVTPLLPLVARRIGAGMLCGVLPGLWIEDDFQESEMMFLKRVRCEYVREFLSEVEGKERWADEL